MKRILDAVDDGRFSVILHNCAAREIHLASLLAAGVHAVHFGAPMNLPEARASAPDDVIVCGNLDPAGVFVGSSTAEVRAHTVALAESVKGRENVVLSSGCDVPASAPLQNIQAFVAAASI